MPDSDVDEITDLSDPNVTTKYQTAAVIANKALEAVAVLCVAGGDVATLCAAGDKLIEDECAKIYNKKEKGEKIEKGIAFPTCVSPNNIAGHFSPMLDESKKLQDGDLVKIDLGVHVDGFIATVAHTVLVGGETVTDRRADVLMAAWNAAEAVLRLVRVGNKSSDVPRIVNKVAQEYDCQPMGGVYSMQVERHSIDGNENIIPNKINPEQNIEEFEFEANEAYSMDISLSTGDGRGKQTELRSTVFRRNEDSVYVLKTPKGRQFVSEMEKRFPDMAFSIRSFEDATMARVGIAECKRHELVSEYPILQEKNGEYIAQFKFTVLLLPGGAKKVTGLTLAQAEQVKSEKKIEDEEVLKILAMSANPKKQKKKKLQTEKKVEQAMASQK